MIELQDTNGNAVAAAIAAQRQRIGASATGMVLTLLILAVEESVDAAVTAAGEAAREHPMRIIALVPGDEGGKGSIDAQLAVGGDQGPGELAVLRLHGEASANPGSVAIPLLLPDTPVVSWWACTAPEVPAEEQIGRHSQRRITDARHAASQVAALRARAAGYQAGDSDLTWANLTGWRSILTSAFDEPTGTVTGAEVAAPPSVAAAGALLAAWLHSRLHVPVRVSRSSGTGLSFVRIDTDGGPIAIRRRDTQRGVLTRPQRPDAVVALPMRSLADALAEELRRLDPDDIYAEALQSLAEVEFPDGDQ